MKASRSLAVAITGVLLGLIHFVPNIAQSIETNFMLGIFFGPLVGSFFVLSAIIFAFLPQKDIQLCFKAKRLHNPMHNKNKTAVDHDIF